MVAPYLALQLSSVLGVVRPDLSGFFPALSLFLCLGSNGDLCIAIFTTGSSVSAYTTRSAMQVLGSVPGIDS